MSQILIGNIIALIGSILMVYSGTVQKKKKIIYIQTIQISLYVLSDLILCGFTGAIINALSCIRNILCYKDKLGKKEKIILTVLSISLSVFFNNLGLIGLLPLVSTITYLWLMDLKDVVSFKILVIFTMVLWMIYDITICSYTSAIFDFMNILANLSAIYMIKTHSKHA